jgi:di/tricarboxylate transporter
VLIEAVVSDRCPNVGRSIKDGRFRTTYKAAVIAVARSGHHLRQKIGEIVLRPGDTLLLEARPAFLEAQRNSGDFFLVSAIEDSTPPRHDRAWIAIAILAAMVATATIFEESGFGMLEASMVAAGLMLITRCCTSSAARRSVDWQVILLIAAALGIGRALEKTGAANAIAQSIIGAAGSHPWVTLAALYGLTMLFTELLSNATSISLVFPIALATAKTLDVSFTPYLVAITIAASCGFATPIGYQTNLMVYGPGGYTFADFLRFGGLLNLVVAAVAIAITPLVYPF